MIDFNLSRPQGSGEAGICWQVDGRQAVLPGQPAACGLRACTCIVGDRCLGWMLRSLLIQPHHADLSRYKSVLFTCKSKGALPTAA